MISNNIRVLCLNADFVPLGTVTWKRALIRTLGEKSATVVEYYDGLQIKDGHNNAYGIPSVIINKKYIHRSYRKVPFSKNNVLRRDNYYCQYCYKKFDKQHLTLDHIIPRSKWDKRKITPTYWTNVVTSCLKCNNKKANKSLDEVNMRLGKWINDDKLVFYSVPQIPTYLEMVIRLMDHNIPVEWTVYLSSIKDRHIEIQTSKV
jgi:5-methylcytosine-specific restriction endonuclease McrA